MGSKQPLKRTAKASDAMKPPPAPPINKKPAKPTGVLSTSELAVDPKNPRSISEAAAKGLSVSLNEFGDLSGIVFNTRTKQLVCGHQRLTQIRQRWGELPIEGDVIRSPEGHEFRVRLVDWPLAKQRSANVAANSQRIAGEFTDGLDVLLSEIKEDSPELFDSLLFGELQHVVSTSTVSEDSAPPVPKKPITKSGDLWLLGSHRLLCGDSSKAECVKRCLEGAKAACVFTDPPYGVSIGAKNKLLNAHPGENGNKGSKRIESDIVDDDLTPAELEARLLPAFDLVRTVAMADDCTVLMTAPQGGELGMMMMMMQKAGLKVRHVLIWKKNQPTFSMGRLDYDYQHEPILMTWGKRHKRILTGPYKTSVWEIDKPKSCPDHPTMKPVALYANAFLNHTDPGDFVYEPYSGSGTAIIAAEQLGRRACAIEIEPKYCDVAVARWEQLTGQKAKRG